MIKLALSIIINGFALWVAARLIDGITLSEEITSILLVALVFGLINAFLRPLVMLITLPALILTLGLFTLVINAGMLALTAWLTDSLNVDGFWSAFWGALLISIVSWVLSSILIDND